MSVLKSRVGPWKMVWKSVPQGAEGVVQVQVKEEPLEVLEVRWRRDSDGIWILLPYGVYGFDIHREWDESGQPLYSVSQRGTHDTWAGVPFSKGESGVQTMRGVGKAKAVRIRAQMPGKIIRVMVEPGQVVEKGQSTLVMEAMKMENEIRAPQSGRVTQVQVAQGQAVEVGADLLFLEPEII